MDWRRALLWAGLATVVTAAVLLIARVSVMTFRRLSVAPEVVAPMPRTGAEGAPADPQTTPLTPSR
jgi:hypothetical protein